MSQPTTMKVANEHPSDIYEQTLFHYRRRVMPKRDLLASILSRKIGLQHPHDGKPLEVLELLCKGMISVAYRDSLQAQDGKCL
jgi:carbonic anhydrase